MRNWALYFGAWVPVGAIYASLIGRGRAMSMASLINVGLEYALLPALLGIVVWWLTGVIRWPARRPGIFFTIQLLLAIAYSVIWLALIVASIAVFTGLSAALTIVRTFASWQLMSGVWMYGITAGLAYTIRVTRALREREASAARAEAARAGAELSALRGQLNPHFLFNTLHTVTALVRRDPQMAEAALEQFAEMLRYVLDVNRADQEDVSLADELQFLRNYLSLEQLRLGDRLRVVEEIDSETLDCLIPSLTLQPLVENAVKYAVAPRVEGGTVVVSATREDSSLVLRVSDDGPGTSSSAAGGAGVGLRAVRQRLEARYPGKSSFEVSSAPDTGFAVRLSLPVGVLAR